MRTGATTTARVAALAMLLAACDGGRGTAEIRDGEEASAIEAPEGAPAPLPPDPPAIEGAPIAHRFALGAPATRDAPDTDHGATHVVTATSSGYVLEARSAGAQRWRTEVAGARGDVRAQVRTSERGVIVSVRAESGDFVDLVDAQSGAVIGRTRLEDDISRAPLDAPASATRARPAWRGAWGSWAASELLVRGSDPAVGVFRAGREGESATEPFWTFRDPYGCIDLALVETSGALIAAQSCAATRGAVLHSLALGGDAEARERWVMRADGLGSLEHSTSDNAIALEVAGDVVRVWGDEAVARYVTTIALESGRELATVLERR